MKYFKFNDNINNILNWCNTKALVHFCRTCIFRAFLQAVISFITIQLYFLAFLSDKNGVALSEFSSLEILNYIFRPAFLGVSGFIIYVFSFILVVASLFGNKLNGVNTDSNGNSTGIKKHENKEVSSKIKSTNTCALECTNKNSKGSDVKFKKYKKIELINNSELLKEFLNKQEKIEKSIRNIHVIGVVSYSLICLIVALFLVYYTHCFEGLLNSNEIRCFIIVFTLFGSLIGFLWNFCDYYAEKELIGRI
ncbi:MAG: hypothetical protein R3Y35_09730 [Clostridia bacterium]